MKETDTSQSIVASSAQLLLRIAFWVVFHECGMSWSS